MKLKFYLHQIIYHIISSMKWSESHSVVSNSLGHNGLYSPWNSLGQNTGVGSLSLFQGIFPTQGSNPGLLQCTQTLYQLSHKESPRILEWVAYPFSSRSSQPRDRTRVSCTAGGFFTNWVIREAHITQYNNIKEPVCLRLKPGFTNYSCVILGKFLKSLCLR